MRLPVNSEQSRLERPAYPCGACSGAAGRAKLSLSPGGTVSLEGESKQVHRASKMYTEEAGSHRGLKAQMKKRAGGEGG